MIQRFNVSSNGGGGGHRSRSADDTLGFKPPVESEWMKAAAKISGSDDSQGNIPNNKLLDSLKKASDENPRDNKSGIEELERLSRESKKGLPVSEGCRVPGCSFKNPAFLKPNGLCADCNYQLRARGRERAKGEAHHSRADFFDNELDKEEARSAHESALVAKSALLAGLASTPTSDVRGGFLNMEIRSGRNLLARDKSTPTSRATSDPFVVAYFGDKEIGRTSVVNQSTNPDWEGNHINATVPAAAPASSSSSAPKNRIIKLIIMDWDDTSANDVLGQVEFIVDGLPPEGELMDQWFQVKPSGDVVGTALGTLRVLASFDRDDTAPGSGEKAGSKNASDWTRKLDKHEKKQAAKIIKFEEGEDPGIAHYKLSEMYEDDGHETYIPARDGPLSSRTGGHGGFEGGGRKGGKSRAEQKKKEEEKASKKAAKLEAEAARFKAVEEAAANKIERSDAAALRANTRRAERHAAMDANGKSSLTIIVCGGWSNDVHPSANAAAEVAPDVVVAAAHKKGHHHHHHHKVPHVEAMGRGRARSEAWLLDGRRWFPVTPMPAPRYAACGVRLGLETLVLGGCERNDPSASAFAFSHKQSTWRVLASMRARRGGCAGGALGMEDMDRTSHDDEENDDKKISKGKAPKGTSAAIASGDGQMRLIVCGGFGTSPNPPPVPSKADGDNKDGSSPVKMFTGNFKPQTQLYADLPAVNTGSSSSGILTTTEEYNPRTGLWTILPGKMVLGVSFAAYGVINGKFYVAGGNAGYTKGGLSKITQMFDPSNNTWTRLKDMPSARAQAASAVVKGRLFVIGGLNERYESRASVYVYDPQKDKWEDWDSTPKMMKAADEAKRGETAKQMRLRIQLEEGTIEPRALKKMQDEERKRNIKARKKKEEKEAQEAERKAELGGFSESESEAGKANSENSEEEESSDEEETVMIPRAERTINGEVAIGVRRGGDAAAPAVGGFVLAGEVPALSYSHRTGWQELPGLPDRTQPAVAQVALFADKAS